VEAKFDEVVKLDRQESKDSDIAPVTFFTPTANDTMRDPFASLVSDSKQTEPPGSLLDSNLSRSSSTNSTTSFFSTTSGAAGVSFPPPLVSPAPMTTISLSNTNIPSTSPTPFVPSAVESNFNQNLGGPPPVPPTACMYYHSFIDFFIATYETYVIVCFFQAVTMM